jgi:hypothetical protein
MTDNDNLTVLQDISLVSLQKVFQQALVLLFRRGGGLTKFDEKTNAKN